MRRLSKIRSVDTSIFLPFSPRLSFSRGGISIMIWSAYHARFAFVASSGVTTVEAYLHMLRSRSRCLLLAGECRVN